MRKFIKTGILSAAVAAVPLLGLASSAEAQYRIAHDGRALDANNRVGSGGRNPSDAGARTGHIPTGNDVVTGNVSGGAHFRGAVPYTDPRAFRGAASNRTVDDFVRQSSGPQSDLAQTIQPYYGESRLVAPPPGFVETEPGSGGYVPSTMIQHRPISDQRLGEVDFAQPSAVLPAPGQLLLPGPVDPSAGQQYITASPLSGIRQIGVNDPTFVPTVTNTQYRPQSGQLTPVQIQQMQDELRLLGDEGQLDRDGARISDVGRTGAGTQEGATETRGTQRQVQTGAQPIRPQTIQQDPTASRIAQRPVDTAIVQQPNDLDTQQGVRQRMVAVPPPQQQSGIYAQLLRQHEQLTQDQAVSDLEAQRAFNALQREQQRLEGPGQAGAGGLPPQPGLPGQPGLPAQPGAAPGVAAPGGIGAAPGAAPGVAVPPPAGEAGGPGVTDYAARNEQLLKRQADEKARAARKMEPVKVPSLATGVKASGLAQVLQNAEALMKEGKFTSALDQYDQAEQVAPNNPLIKLGRANAELGASYYARAEAHLREVLSKNPELLQGQYDLMSMLGEQRLQVLVKDLKDVANKNPQEARPVFLLAYVYYNIGDPARAEGYVDLADKRSGGRDPFFKLLREHWSLPAETAPAQGAEPSTEVDQPDAPIAQPAGGAQPPVPPVPPDNLEADEEQNK